MGGVVELAPEPLLLCGVVAYHKERAGKVLVVIIYRVIADRVVRCAVAGAYNSMKTAQQELFCPAGAINAAVCAYI